MKRLGMIVLLAWTALALPSFGDISVSPPVPNMAETVTIRLANHFGAESSVASASISQTGPNSFAITQNVNWGCLIPSDPLVTSVFPVGPLAPGTYTVTATINFLDPSNFGCVRAPLVQTFTFQVTAGTIPTLDPAALVVLVLTLSGVALSVLARR